MSGSASERAIRDAVADHLRSLGGRVVHELVVGGSRADLALIREDWIALVEIKSERDTLDRLHGQCRDFTRAAHMSVLVAHEVWWNRVSDHGIGPYLVSREEWNAPGPWLWGATWIYPRPHTAVRAHALGEWRLYGRDAHRRREPQASALLDLLWRDELLEECSRHRVSTGRRATRDAMIRDMVWLMTGKEIARAVCRQLRKRSFPEADPAIVESGERRA